MLHIKIKPRTFSMSIAFQKEVCFDLRMHILSGYDYFKRSLFKSKGKTTSDFISTSKYNEDIISLSQKLLQKMKLCKIYN